MSRRSVNIAAMMALICCAAITTIWARSWTHPLTFYFTRDRQQCRAWLHAGRAGIDNEPQVVFETAQHERDLQLMSNMSGMDLMAMPPSHVALKWSRSSGLLLPMIVIVFAGIGILPPTLRVTTRLNRTARRRCPTCAYNLTGNTSGICPECGSAINSTRGQHA